MSVQRGVMPTISGCGRSSSSTSLIFTVLIIDNGSSIENDVSFVLVSLPAETGVIIKSASPSSSSLILIKITGERLTKFVRRERKATTMKMVKNPILKERGFFFMSS